MSVKQQARVGYKRTDATGRVHSGSEFAAMRSGTTTATLAPTTVGGPVPAINYTETGAPYSEASLSYVELGTSRMAAAFPTLLGHDRDGERGLDEGLANVLSMVMHCAQTSGVSLAKVKATSQDYALNDMDEDDAMEALGLPAHPHSVELDVTCDRELGSIGGVDGLSATASARVRQVFSGDFDKAYGDGTEALSTVMCDLRHWAGRHEIDFDEALAQAGRYVNEDLAWDQGQAA